MGQILLVVIAIVVVWKLAPHLIAKFATMAGKAAVTAQSVVAAMKAGTLIKTVGATAAIAGSGAAAAVGSIVSQSVGVATGIQEKFSWKDVGMAFISGGVGAGMAGVGGSSLGGAFVRGAASSAISQGIGVALGLQDKFSWAAVAAAGVTSVATQAISTAGSKYETVDGKQTRIAGSSWVERANHGLATALGGGELASQMSDAIVGAGVGLVGAMSGAAAQSLIDGSDFGDNLRAALPSIAGNMLASGVIAMLENACFVAGTQIQTVTGLKAIEDLKPGDWVYSRAESGDDPTIHRRQILETYRFEDKATLTLTFSTSTGPYTVTTTELHPFYVEGQGWTAAHELMVGDSIQLMDGGVATLEDVEAETRLSTVFNFAVDVDHTYFIGDVGLWVHNRYRDFEVRVSDDGLRRQSVVEKILEAIDENDARQPPGAGNNNARKAVKSILDALNEKPDHISPALWDKFKEATGRKIDIKIGNSLQIVGREDGPILVLDVSSADGDATYIGTATRLTQNRRRGEVLLIDFAEDVNRRTDRDLPGNLIVVQKEFVSGGVTHGSIGWFNASTIGNARAFASYWANPRYNAKGNSQDFQITTVIGPFDRQSRVTFSIDQYNRTTQVSGTIRNYDIAADRNLPPVRNGYEQGIAGKPHRGVNDDGGHLIGARFGGAAEAFNLVAMEKGINRGSFNQFEKEMSRLVSNGSTRFDMSISYSGSSARPTGFVANYRMGGEIITFRGRQ
jgi:hypothetical protein